MHDSAELDGTAQFCRYFSTVHLLQMHCKNYQKGQVNNIFLKIIKEKV